MKKFLVYFLMSSLCIFFPAQSNAQAKNSSDILRHSMDSQNMLMDSLMNLLNKTSQDTTRLRIYKQLCDQCNIRDNLKYAQPLVDLADKLILKSTDPEQKKYFLRTKAMGYKYMSIYYGEVEGRKASKTLSYLLKGLSIYEQIDDLDGIVKTRLSMADYFGAEGNMMKQLENLQWGLDYARSKKDLKGMSKFNLQLIFLFSEIGDTSQALSYLEKGIALEKQIGDFSRLPRSYFLIGIAYYKLLRYDEAITYFKKSIQSYEKDGNVQALPEIFENIGDAYMEKGEFDEALGNFRRSTEISEKNNDPRGLFMSLLGTGKVYKRQGKYKEAIALHKKVLSMAEEIKIDEAIAIASGALARDYLGEKDYRNGKLNVERGLAIVRRTGAVDELVNWEKLAYQIDSSANNYQDALHHYEQFIALKNKLNLEDFTKRAARERFQRELEKQKLSAEAEQEKRDAINNEEKEKQKIIIYAVSGGLILLLLLVGFILRGLREKQRANSELISKNEVIARQKHLVEEKHKEITDSINYAERIQRSFLASKELLDENLEDYFIFFRPKDVVSGDFYWAAVTGESSQKLFCFCAADSTGHGVPGAIMSLLNITSLERAVESNTDPAEILADTRKTIISRLKRDGSAEGGKDGMDCSFLVFDFVNNVLKIAAANNPVWIVREGVLIEIKPDKMPVGKHEKDHESFKVHTVELRKGDAIYTLTDGFADQFGGSNGKKFMSKNLKELLVKQSHLAMGEQKNLVESAFLNWIGSYEQVDDVTLIGIRV